MRALLLSIEGIPRYSHLAVAILAKGLIIAIILQVISRIISDTQPFVIRGVVGNDDPHRTTKE